MTGPAEIGRKVRQLDNDVQSIYELLGAIQETQSDHGNRLDAISAAQVEMTATQRRQGNRLSEISAAQMEMTATQRRQGNRLDEVTAAQAEHSTVLAEHSAVLAEHSGKLTEITAVQADQGAKLDAILELLRRNQ